MTHHWRYEDGNGTPVPGPSVEFEDAAAAEDWFGAHWEELAADGVEQVVLFDGDERVYGPMPLSPA